MNLLVTGEVVEFLDPGLDVVAGDFFPGHDGSGIHTVLGQFVGINRGLRHIQPEIALRLHHGDPEFAL